MIDVDGDHGLTIDEWKEGLHKAGIDILTTQSESSFGQADKDNDGKISQIEFVNYCKATRQAAAHPEIDDAMVADVKANGIYEYLKPGEIAHGASSAPHTPPLSDGLRLI